MRIMGLDVGEKTIGVAVSDSLGMTAQGVDVIRRSNPHDDVVRLHEMAQKYEVEHIVIGFPKNMDGTIGPRAKQCERFASELKRRLELPVTLWDERLSTVSAERTLIAGDVSRKRRKRVIDKVAAALILQTYLDALRRESRA